MVVVVVEEKVLVCSDVGGSGPAGLADGVFL